MPQLGTKKSRSGCSQCKRRRVKCDERTPCGNCRRRSEACSLAVVSPSSGSSGLQEPLDERLPSTYTDWVQDLELMHHYRSTFVSTLVGQRKDISTLWTEVIPQEAFRHPFLLHGLLSMAALSLAHERPEEASIFLQLGDKHQAVSLSGFRKALAGEITQDVSSALFALSSCTSVLSVARPCVVAAQMAEPKYIDMDSITECFLMVRGVREVIHVAHEFIAESPMSVMFWGHAMPESEEDNVHLPPPVLAQFEAMQLMLDERCLPFRTSFLQQSEAPTSSDLHLCTRALDSLRDLYRHLRYFTLHSTVGTAQLWRWGTTLEPGYVQLIKDRHQPALVVLAYFAAANTLARQTWYVHGWSEYAVRGIEMALGEEMQRWLDWPRDQMTNGFEALREKA